MFGSTFGSTLVSALASLFCSRRISLIASFLGSRAAATGWTIYGSGRSIRTDSATEAAAGTAEAAAGADA